MKLSELVDTFEGLQLFRDKEFASFGFCELKNTPDMLIYLNDENYINKALKNKNVTAVLATPKIGTILADSGLGIIITEHPDECFYEMHNACAKKGLLYNTNDAKTVIGKDCIISPYAHIAPKGVVIGDRAVIEPGAVINENVTIGDDCFIGANTVIGTRGFQYLRAGEKPVYMEHLGGVIIGDRVDIFSCSTVAAGKIEPTVINDDVKIDNQVHIAHSDIIGEGTFIAGGVKLCGNVNIGKHVWLGVNSSVAQMVNIGDEAYICIGAVVARNVKARAKVSGNFAEDHEKRIIRDGRLRKITSGTGLLKDE